MRAVLTALTLKAAELIMAKLVLEVTAGVDTHAATHHAAAIAANGRLLGDRRFLATPAGNRALLSWLRSFGQLRVVGVEGANSYGASLSRYLREQNVSVIEVNQPSRTVRRAQGKSDPIDAINAARSVQAGIATAIPKTATGAVESIRMLTVARGSAVKARTAAINQLKSLIISAPDQLRTQLAPLTDKQRLTTCAGLRPDSTHLDQPINAAKTALRSIARRIIGFNQEITALDTTMRPVIERTAPHLMALKGVGPRVAADLLITAGDNPCRLTSEAAFARLTGVAPIPASSGRNERHRLHRGGDRRANSALYWIVISRLSNDPQTIAYRQRKNPDSKATKHTIRCLKRYAARQAYTAIIKDLNTLTTNPPQTT